MNAPDLETWDRYYIACVNGLLSQCFTVDGETSATYTRTEHLAKGLHKAAKLADLMLVERKRREKEANKPLGGDRERETEV
jgi:hypothetical protein